MTPAPQTLRVAILAFAEIKAAVEDFEQGEVNLLDALARIKDALALTTAADCSRSEAA
jgi:exonuclease VII small subunit